MAVRGVVLVCGVVLGLGLVPGPAAAASAPGAPGVASAWTTGAKQGLGTSTTTGSKVWYTIGNGVTNEVFYPRADTPNVQDLQYLVTDGHAFTDRESADTTHEVRRTDPASLTYEQMNTARSGRYRLTKTYVTDPDRSTLLVHTRFQVLTGGPLRLYVRYDPSLNNSGGGDTGSTGHGQLRAADGPVASALAASTGFTETTNGYAGTASDGLLDLGAHHALTERYDSAGTPGNLVQTARLPVGMDTTFTLALGFGATTAEAGRGAWASLVRGWPTVSAGYARGWHDYLDSLPAPPGSVTAAGMTGQYRTALMTLKAHEDKTYRGAFVASLSTPWGHEVNADACCGPGYHVVWGRDLYHVATAALAAGDRAAANRALDYLLTVQQRADGSYPVNSWVDGRTVWPSLQLDEVSFPIVLAWQLGRTDAASWAKVKLSADFLVAHGPTTPQERWEKVAGYSPSTIAAEIAALVCAADLARANGDTSAASSYLDTADSWQRQVESWTYTTSGPLPPHYQWIDDNGDPNDGHLVTTTHGGINKDERIVLDATAFLELVRLGTKRADDPHITSSLSVVDSMLRVGTPQGDLWYRHSYDGYGETAEGKSPYNGRGIGRLWPLTAGERGEHALASGQPAAAAGHLRAMAGSANAGGLIPEQVWDRADTGELRLGQGTGSATPLAWAQAQFVRLAVSISAGRNVETPAVVARRYLG